jgi:hypothetical protein
MKFSHEYNSEEQARAREQALKAAGYASWLTCKADGTWQVFWLMLPVAA